MIQLEENLGTISLIDKFLLKSITFFDSLDDDILEKLIAVAKLKKFVMGEVLFYERDKNSEIFFLHKGSIKFYKVDRFENEIFLYKLNSNSIIYDISKFSDFGDISCFSNAEFLEDSEVLAFDSLKFIELMNENSAFMNKILQESFKMISKLQCLISRDVVFDGTAKVAHMLVNDLKNFNSLKKHEIAYMLHIQPETLSRILKKLTRNGIIEIEKNSVKILNINELKNIYE